MLDTIVQQKGQLGKQKSGIGFSFSYVEEEKPLYVQPAELATT